MRTEELAYDMPPDLIAQEPAPRREDARLLALDRRTGATTHVGIRDFPGLLRAGDVLVVNDTRVLAARLDARRATGGAVEVLLLEPVAGRDDGAWRALLQAGGRLREGERLDLAGGGLRIVGRAPEGPWLVAAEGATMGALMALAGRMPLPPYIRRGRDDPRAALDRERYQTVFAREEGAVAAPTAGLHLTEDLLREVRGRGAHVAPVTLHVGLGTFLPVHAERVEDHPMHEETYRISDETAAAVRRARAGGGRVVAVGTTAVRALEASAAASEDGLPTAGTARTSILIAPGHPWRVVDALLTNFHLPRSTLLCLVAAFAGIDHVLAAYREAVARRYRFYSYGDAMFIA